tara:strand:- start:1597 stop:2001 length:405 start_codon:yes stop_codon:yes gene_type:complete
MFLGILLLYTSFDKIKDPASFAKAIRLYDIPFLVLLSNVMALVMPWLELFVGACLIMGIFLGGAIFLAFGLMSIFFIAVLQAVLRGISGDCGCGTPGEDLLSWTKVLENMLFLIMAFVVWRSDNHLFKYYPKSV